MKLLIYGSREFGEVLRALVSDCGHEFSGYIDDLEPSREDVLGTFDEVRKRHAPPSHGIVVAVGYKDLAARWRVFERVQAAGYAVPALIHPQAYVRDPQSVGAGSVVMACAIVDVRARVGRACVLWPGANVSHDSAVGDNSFLSPNCTICGSASLGAHCFVGAGAVVTDHRDVPGGSVLKAGQVWS